MEEANIGNEVCGMGQVYYDFAFEMFLLVSKKISIFGRIMISCTKFIIRTLLFKCSFWSVRT